MKAAAAPAFSAVIPAYNRERTVGRAIESALSQSHPPAEIIVVDDGSSDATAEVARGFGGPVRCVQQANAGAPAARNRGAREASAPWIALLDSDDYWTNDHLSRIGEAIRGTDGRADLYFADTMRTEQHDHVSQWSRAGFAIDGPFAFRENGADWVLKAHIPMMLQASVFHRERFLAAGGLCERLTVREDTHAFYRTCMGGPVCAVANLGAHMTSDDADGRLTSSAGRSTRRYWELSVLMWSDLQARFPDATPRHRRFLRGELAIAHRRLAGFDLRSGRLGPGLRQLAQSFALAPVALLSAAPGALARWTRAAPG